MTLLGETLSALRGDHPLREGGGLDSLTPLGASQPGIGLRGGEGRP